MLLSMRVLLTVLAGAAFLAGCAADKHAVTLSDMDGRDIAAELAACCPSEGKFPVELVNFAEANSMWVMPFTRGFVLREAFLQTQPAAQDYLFDGIEPFDVIFVFNGSRISGQNGEGYFGHMAIYMGSEAQLRALGVWDHPAVVPFHERIRAGYTSIEAIDAGVRVSTRAMVLDADGAAVFRPTGLTGARKRAAAIDFFTEVGKPFDFHFDLASNDRIYCTELIHNFLPELNFPVTLTYGRPSIWPDEVAAAAMTGGVPMAFRRYAFADGDGWEKGDKWLLGARILEAW
jgi:hypothetical protein